MNSKQITNQLDFTTELKSKSNFYLRVTILTKNILCRQPKSKRDYIAGCFTFFSSSLSPRWFQLLFHLWLTCLLLFCLLNWTVFRAYMCVWVNYDVGRFLMCDWMSEWLCGCVSARVSVCSCTYTIVVYISMHPSRFDFYTFFHTSTFNQWALDWFLGVIVITHCCCCVKVFVHTVRLYACLCDTHQIYTKQLRRPIHIAHSYNSWGFAGSFKPIRHILRIIPIEESQ